MLELDLIRFPILSDRINATIGSVLALGSCAQALIELSLWVLCSILLAGSRS